MALGAVLGIGRRLLSAAARRRAARLAAEEGASTAGAAASSRAGGRAAARAAERARMRTEGQRRTEEIRAAAAKDAARKAARAEARRSRSRASPPARGGTSRRTAAAGAAAGAGAVAAAGAAGQIASRTQARAAGGGRDSRPTSPGPSARRGPRKNGTVPQEPTAAQRAQGSLPRPTAKPASVKSQPRSIAAARKAGKDFFIGRDGKKKAAVTAEQLRAWEKKTGKKGLRAYLNANK